MNNINRVNLADASVEPTDEELSALMADVIANVNAKKIKADVAHLSKLRSYLSDEISDASRKGSGLSV